jgi:hypothetical protein
MRSITASLACAILAVSSAVAVETPDLSKIDRHIQKQPPYASSRPLYGMMVLGPSAKDALWLVLDTSKAKGERYDVLYADLNFNGDISEPSERFVGQLDGDSIRFELPDLEDRSAGSRHTRFRVRVSGRTAVTVMVSLKWRDGFAMGGGYPEDGDGLYMSFAEKPELAPIVWANGDGPFRFQRWYGDKLPIGGSEDFKVFVGQLGAGASSFWAFQEHFLPEDEGVQATLICQDGQGKELRAICELKERC